MGRKLLLSTLLTMESRADDAIAWCLDFFKQHKRKVIAGWALCLLLLHRQLIAYVHANVVEPFAAAMDAGLQAEEIADAFGLGFSSGLSAPSTTVIALLVLSQAHALLVAPLSVPALAIAAAVNVAMTVLDVLVWTTVFAPLGAKLVKGGRYVRPFLAGSIPWALSCPVLWQAGYYLSLPVVKFLTQSRI